MESEGTFFGGARGYASTHWSRLLVDGPTESRPAWEYFYERYRPAVTALYRRLNVPVDQVDDFVHGFFVVAFEREFLDRADPGRGRFRGYLRTAAERYLQSERRHQMRLKRRPEGGVGSLDDPDRLHQPSAPPGPEPGEAYDRAWAQAVLDTALRRAEEALVARGREDHWRAFRLRTDEGLGWPEIAEAIAAEAGPEAVRKAVERVRARIARYIREEVGATVGTTEDLDRELATLAEILSA